MSDRPCIQTSSSLTLSLCALPFFSSFLTNLKKMTVKLPLSPWKYLDSYNCASMVLGLNALINSAPEIPWCSVIGGTTPSWAPFILYAWELKQSVQLEFFTLNSFPLRRSADDYRRGQEERWRAWFALVLMMDGYRESRGCTTLLMQSASCKQKCLENWQFLKWFLYWGNLRNKY